MNESLVLTFTQDYVTTKVNYTIMNYTGNIMQLKVIFNDP